MKPGLSAEWSNTEVHFQYGTLDVPTFAGGGDAKHAIVTLQHASGWKYGDNFFFVDFLNSDNPQFQDSDVYSEWYSNFSLGKITGNEVGFGIVSDIGLIIGLNWAGEAKVRKYLPGVRFSMDLPGFAFANLDVMAYIDDSEGVSRGGAPKEDNSYLVDFNFKRPFKIGEANFSVEGHAEYAASRYNEFGERVESWVFAQPQIRWYPKDSIALGIEYQYWNNKLGDQATDESAIQALFVWVF
jgi:nucleoside-specific outer membrane channel protein Tsx